LLRDYGIEPTFGFIMFEPNSTLESVRNNFEFLQEMGIMTNPAVTAHLLHHRQTIFEGTPDYQSMIPDSACQDVAFTNYEIFYTIKDPKTEAFSTVISHVCRTALSLLPNTFTCENNASRAGNEKSSNTINTALTTIFEKTLCDFETKRIPDNPDAIRDTSQNLAHEVKAIFANNQLPVTIPERNDDQI